MSLYPLKFREILRDYPFGARRIASAFQKTGLPEDHPLSETWEVCDRERETSVVVNGRLRGKTLRELIEQYKGDLLGENVMQRHGGRFPLLIKFLDCTNELGEQVHQSDEIVARTKEDYSGKTEAWYVVEARPNAEIRCGAVPGLTSDQLRQACREGTIREKMPRHKARPGDSFLLYSGTMHYSPGGILLYEIMQNSDVIAGLRRPADDTLNEEARKKILDAIEDAVDLEAGADYRTHPVEIENEHTSKISIVLACEHFALARFDLPAGADQPLPLWKSSFSVLSQIEGACRISGEHEHLELRRGQSCMIPASLSDATVEADRPASLLCAWVPELQEDIIEPLRRQGVSARCIAGLGGHSCKNVLPRLLKQG